jgi:F-type H+-transporting ATPase subunit b
MGKETSVRARWNTAIPFCVAWAFPQLAAAAEGLNLAPRPWLVLTNLAIVLLLIWPINRLLIAPLVGVLREREARTQGSSNEVDALRAESQAELSRLEEIQDQIHRAAAERRSSVLSQGRADEQRVLDAARAEAAQSIGAMRATIASELEQARAGLRGEADALAQLAAERILGRSL